MLAFCKEHNAIAVKPSSYALGKLDSPPVYHVVHSMHSSYCELVACVSALRPREVIATAGTDAQSRQLLQQVMEPFLRRAGTWLAVDGHPAASESRIC
jgi:hypothetical protein